MKPEKRKRTRLGILRSQRDSLKKEIDKLREELAELRTKMDPARIQEMEIQREELGNELIGSQENSRYHRNKPCNIRIKVWECS